MSTQRILLTALVLLNLSFIHFFDHASAEAIVSPLSNPTQLIKKSKIELVDKGTMVATWYGSRFHGRRTANGERYDQNSYTAAHKHLPFGTLLKVTNPLNGKSTVVRINDRGPRGKADRLDISRGAAKELGMIGSGRVRLKVEMLNISGRDELEVAAK